jgi:hypothetical protein
MLLVDLLLKRIEEIEQLNGNIGPNSYTTTRAVFEATES